MTHSRSEANTHTLTLFWPFGLIIIIGAKVRMIWEWEHEHEHEQHHHLAAASLRCLAQFCDKWRTPRRCRRQRLLLLHLIISGPGRCRDRRRQYRVQGYPKLALRIAARNGVTTMLPYKGRQGKGRGRQNRYNTLVPHTHRRTMLPPSPSPSFSVSFYAMFSHMCRLTSLGNWWLVIPPVAHALTDT